MSEQSRAWLLKCLHRLSDSYWQRLLARRQKFVSSRNSFSFETFTRSKISLSMFTHYRVIRNYFYVWKCFLYTFFKCSTILKFDLLILLSLTRYYRNITVKGCKCVFYVKDEREGFKIVNLSSSKACKCRREVSKSLICRCVSLTLRFIRVPTARCEFFAPQSKTAGKKNERIKWSTKRTSVTLRRNSISRRGGGEGEKDSNCTRRSV